MAAPHPALLDLAARRDPRSVPPQERATLAASADEHRMGGLLWSSVAAGKLELPPAEVRSLAMRDLAAQGRHRRLWDMLGVIQERLAPLDVRVATVKGISAEWRWYSRIGERPCNDLDLLLDPGALPKVREVLAALEGSYVPADAAPLLRAGILQSLDIDLQGIEVDLHTDLLKVEVPTRNARLLWSRTKVLSGPPGVEALVIDAETSLIHFLIHLHKDRFSRLLGFADIARILAAEDLDWEYIDDFLVREGLQFYAYSALHTVVRRLDLPSPPMPAPTGWRARAWRSLWPDHELLLGEAGYARRLGHQHLWIPWLAKGRAAEALRWFARRRAFPPRSLLDVYYPDTTGPYLVRLLVGRVATLRRNRRKTRDRPVS
jgi:hypothetical protein